MPYRTVEDINDRVRSVLPREAQVIFMQGYNSAWEKGESEQVCFMRAWMAVKRAGFRKGPDGIWE
jgi:cation transport regulator ChaB